VSPCRKASHFAGAAKGRNVAFLDSYSPSHHERFAAAAKNSVAKEQKILRGTVEMGLVTGTVIA
jgi:hypothetical protein